MTTHCHHFQRGKKFLWIICTLITNQLYSRHPKSTSFTMNAIVSEIDEHSTHSTCPKNTNIMLDEILGLNGYSKNNIEETKHLQRHWMVLSQNTQKLNHRHLSKRGNTSMHHKPIDHIPQTSSLPHNTTKCTCTINDYPIANS